MAFSIYIFLCGKVRLAQCVDYRVMFAKVSSTVCPSLKKKYQLASEFKNDANFWREKKITGTSILSRIRISRQCYYGWSVYLLALVRAITQFVTVGIQTLQ